MDAVGFGSLADRFADRPVVTYDPRGAGRNPTGTSEVPPEQHAEDLHRVIEALGVGPVDASASSGGAINLLALARGPPGRRPPRRRRTSPRSRPYLPDREEAVAAARRHEGGLPRRTVNGPAMARFFAPA